MILVETSDNTWDWIYNILTFFAYIQSPVLYESFQIILPEPFSFLEFSTNAFNTTTNSSQIYLFNNNNFNLLLETIVIFFCDNLFFLNMVSYLIWEMYLNWGIFAKKLISQLLFNIFIFWFDNLLAISSG